MEIECTSAEVEAACDETLLEVRRRCEPQPSFDQYYEWEGKVIYDGEHREWFWAGHEFLDGDPVNGTPGPAMVALCPFGRAGDEVRVAGTSRLLRIESVELRHDRWEDWAWVLHVTPLKKRIGT